MSGIGGMLSPLAIPWRRFRQQRLSTRAPRGRRPALAPVATASRRPRWIAEGTIAVALLGLSVGGWSSTRTDEAYERLERVGLRVPGVVTEIRGGGKGLTFADVEFDFDGEHRKTTLNHHTEGFFAGEEVTVLVDPDDHRSVTVLGIARASGGMEVLEIGGMFGFLILCPLGLVWARRVSLAGDLVVATGWRRFEGQKTAVGKSTDGLQRRGEAEPELVLLSMPFGAGVHDGPFWVAGPTSGPMAVRDGAGRIAIARRRVLPTGRKRSPHRLPP